MLIDEIIKGVQEHPLVFITIITFVATILCQMLTIIEFLRSKGYWDYYFIDKSFWHTRNRSFNPEYLLTSLLIITIMFLIIIYQQKNGLILNSMDTLAKTVKKHILSYIHYQFKSTDTLFTILLTIIIAFIIFSVVFLWFSKDDKLKGIYDIKEYRKFALVKAIYTTIKYVFLFSFFLMAYYFAVDKKDYIPFGCIIIVAVVFELIYEYNVAKQLVSWNRKFEIISEEGEDDKKSEEGKKYCILEKINTEKYYVVKAIKENNETIKLYLDQWMIVSATGKEVQTEVYKNHIRYFNKRDIDDKTIIKKIIEFIKNDIFPWLKKILKKLAKLMKKYKK